MMERREQSPELLRQGGTGRGVPGAHKPRSNEVSAISGAALSRRGFVQGATAGAAGLVACELLGSAPSAKAQAGETPSATYVPGTYTAVAQGNGGPVSVSVEVDEHAVLAVEAQGDGETEGIGTLALEQIPAAIVAAQSPDVEAVSGATVTSDAIMRAVGAALREASGNADAAMPPADGRYVTRALGMLSYVRVCTTFKDGAIAEVKVLSSDETRHLSDAAESTLPGRIVEAQSLLVDTVTGATVTSNAILSAVRQAIELAGGDPIAFEIPVEVPEPTPSEVVDTPDVAIVGAGLAGLTAGYNLARAGKVVNVYEKLPYYGASFLCSGGTVLCADTIVHKSYAAVYGEEALFDYVRSIDNLIDYKLSTLSEESPFYNPEMPLMRTMLVKSGEMVDKLITQEGFGFCPYGKYSKVHIYFGPSPWANYKQNNEPADIVQRYVETIRAAGGTVYLSTAATSLRCDDEGRVCGLVAVGEDGVTHTVDAKAVLLATGGWMNNRELVEEYLPEYKDYYVNALISNTGDGLFMAKEVGGDWVGMDAGITSTNKAYHSKNNTIFFSTDIPIVLVNAHGERFVDESSSYKKYLRQCKDPQHGGAFYYIFDEVGWELAHDSDTYDLSYYWLIEHKDIVEYENAEDLAQKLEMPELLDTLAKSNAVALGEGEDEFGRKNLPYLQTDRKMYAMRIEPGAYITLGGLRIDNLAHVQRADLSAIPGLYAAGLVTGSVEALDGGDYGNGNTQALAYGLQAAETILADME